MSGPRLALRRLRPLIPLAARTSLGRSLLLAGLRSTPWRASETEAHALREGFVEADGYWQMLWWGILADVPSGLDRIDCPVVLAQGTLDLVAVGQTPRYVAVTPGARFVPLYGAGHAPSPTPLGSSCGSSTSPPPPPPRRAVERPRTPTALRPSA